MIPGTGIGTTKVLIAAVVLQNALLTSVAVITKFPVLANDAV